MKEVRFKLGFEIGQSGEVLYRLVGSVKEGREGMGGSGGGIGGLYLTVCFHKMQGGGGHVSGDGKKGFHYLTPLCAIYAVCMYYVMCVETMPQKGLKLILFCVCACVFVITIYHP